MKDKARIYFEETESEIVKQLGEAMGYGRVMQLCEKLWRDKLGDLKGGEHSTGCCVAFLVACPCQYADDCDWCCGAGRVTEKVAGAMAKEKDE